jgi:hypothetical protein
LFIEPTVIVLGAGASVEYGFPTGSQLVRKVIETCRERIGIIRPIF